MHTAGWSTTHMMLDYDSLWLMTGKRDAPGEERENHWNHGGADYSILG